MTSKLAARVSGTFLRPGVSKNKKLYTAENIGRAVARMQESLANPESDALTSYASHKDARDDNSLMKVGRITKVDQLPDGSATFEAEIVATAAGRDIALLADADLARQVSIRGGWVGDFEVVENNGEMVLTAPDIQIDGIDFTGRPGVSGAMIEKVELFESFDPEDESNRVILESVESDDIVITREIFEEVVEPDEEAVSESQRDLIESVTETVIRELMEKDSSKPYGDVKYADPGYQSDKKKRYPIDSAKHVRAAWSYINESKNTEPYTPAQLQRIKSRIKSAAKKFGIDVQEEFNTLVNDMQAVLEAYASMSLDNNAANISISGYDIDPDNLASTATLIAAAAVLALNTLDPDADGDVVTPGEAAEESFGTKTPATNADKSVPCPACEAEMPAAALYCPTCGQPVPITESTSDKEDNQPQEEVDMTTESTEANAKDETATEESAAPTFSAADLKAIASAVAEILKPTIESEEAPKADEDEDNEDGEEAPAEETAAAEESAAPKENEVSESITLTPDQLKAIVTQSIEESRRNEVADYRRSGGGRVGHVTSRAATESFDGDDEDAVRRVSEMKSADFRDHARSVWESQPFFNNLFQRADRGF